MRKYVLTVLISLSCSLAFGQVLPCVYHTAGAELRFFEDRVRVRTSPSLNAEVLGLGKINETVTVLERDPVELMLENVRAHWYKVRWNGKEGYVWGGLIANVFYDADFDGDGKDETLLVRIQVRDLDYIGYGIESWPEYLARYRVEFRLARNSVVVADRPFGDWNYSQNNINAIDTFSLKLPYTIVLLEVGFGFGDGPGYSLDLTVFYLKKNSFVPLYEIHDEGFTGYDDNSNVIEDYEKKTYVFTEEQHKRKNVLIVEQWETRKTTEGETKELLWRKVFFWTGKEFVELPK